ncbi:MAG: DUF342 domain-containing protein [Ruminiclostridium sp.]|nr:DUF342 domain-containing protein [Ruminiclostridium sp.]
MEENNRFNMANTSMSELVELEQATAVMSADTPIMQRENDNPALKCDALPKVVVSDNRLEANMCVFAPQFGGKDVTVEMMKQVLKDEHVKYGIDEELLFEIAANKLYDKVFTVATGEPAIDGQDGYVSNKYDEVKKLVPKTLEDGSVDFRDLGLVVNVQQNDIICEITYETMGTAGKNVYGQEILPKPGRTPQVPQGPNTVLSADRTKLYAAEGGNLIFKNGCFSVETTFVIHEDVCVSTGNVNFIGDVVINGSVQEGFTVTAGKSITVKGMVTGAVLTAQGDINVKNGVFTSTLTSATGNINIGFGENNTITTRGNLTSTSLIGCKIKIEGNLDCIKNPGVLVGGECSVMGNFQVAQLGHKNYIHTIVSIGSVTNLVMEKDSLEKQCAEIDETISKINKSIEFLQEKKRNGEHLDETKEAFISSAIRMKVQKAVEKKPLRARIEEIQHIINAKEEVTVNVLKHVYPNVRINLNSFATTTSAEYGKCRIVCGPNDIEFKP